MSKHTPGPWIIKDCGIANAPYRIHGGNWFVTSVADVFCDESPDKPEYDANARLIAAAPEMLEALKAALATLDQVKEYTGLEPYYGGIRSLKLIKDSIAKAGGQ